MTTRDKDETEAEEPEPFVNPVQDLRRWVSIENEDGEAPWHLIDQEATAGNASPVTTMCGRETTSHLFLDRLPGGLDSDPGLVNEDCYGFAGIAAPKKGKKADEDEDVISPEAQTKAAAKKG